ncbi:MAG: glycogen/starch synthase, partial [Rhodothermales bacterium]
TEILMGDRKETLKVKVASIPGIRLQVYFMDSNHYFKRKGVYTNKQGDAFDDNAERALFFGRAALETIRNLGWRPDIVHAFGWMSGFVPMLLHSDFSADPLFEEAKSVYSPGGIDHRSPISEAFASTFGLNGASKLGAGSPVHVGREYADAVILSSSAETGGDDAFQFSGTLQESVDVTRLAYEQVMSEVAA